MVEILLLVIHTVTIEVVDDPVIGKRSPVANNDTNTTEVDTQFPEMFWWTILIWMETHCGNSNTNRPTER